MPDFDDLDWSGSDMVRADFEHLMQLNAKSWNRELTQHDEWFEKLSDRLPRELSLTRTELGLRLAAKMQTNIPDTPMAARQ